MIRSEYVKLRHALDNVETLSDQMWTRYIDAYIEEVADEN